MTKRLCFTALGLLVGFGLVALPAQGQQYVASTYAGVSPGLLVATSSTSTTVTLTVGDGGPAISGKLMAPCAVAWVNGNVFILENAGQRVRLVNGSGIGTVGGYTNLATTTVGNVGYTGDGASATASTAAFSYPQGLAVDAAANVYVADTNNYVIRKFSVGGNLATFAGLGNSSGYSGDGGPANKAQLLLPRAVALDTAGNVYIADGNLIRKVNAAGTISTIAGSTNKGFFGDGGSASAALFNSPQGLMVDPSGNVYVADTFNQRIRKISTSGIVTTIAGGGTSLGDGGPAVNAQLTAPTGIAMDASGAIYIAEHNRVRRVATNGIISTIAGTGTDGYSGDGNLGTGAQLDLAYGVSVDSAGNVYVADSGNNIVRRLTPVASATITNAASNQPGAVAPGEIVTIFGTGLGSDPLTQQTVDTSADPRGYFDPALNGVTVNFSGYPAPIVYQSSKQIAVIVPYAVAGLGGSAIVQVLNNGTTAAAFSTLIAASAPEIFSRDGSGTGQAAAINTNGTLNSTANPAPPGSAVVLYLTGEGLTTPLDPDGLVNNASYGLPKPILPVTATVGGVSVGVEYAGAASTLVAGVMQLNLRLPVGIATGNAVPVKVTIGGVTSKANITIAIR